MIQQYCVSRCHCFFCGRGKCFVKNTIKKRPYNGPDKSLARPGREKKLRFLSEWREFPSAPCLAGKKLWWQLASRCFWNASELISLLVWLRTYQHPGKFIRTLKQDWEQWLSYGLYNRRTLVRFPDGESDFSSPWNAHNASEAFQGFFSAGSRRGEVLLSGLKLTNLLSLDAKLGKRGTIASISHTPVLRAHGQFYVELYSSRMVRKDQIIDLELSGSYKS